MKTFFCDIDGIILDFEATIRSGLEAHLGRLLYPPWCFTFEEAFGLPDSALGVPTVEPNAVWHHIYETSSLLYPDAFDFIVRLRRADWYVVGLSNRTGAIAQDASRRDLTSVPFNELVYVNSTGEKYEHLRRALPTYYVDDNPRYAANAAEVGATTFLLQREWNQRCADLGGYTRVYSLTEIAKVLGA